jgi:prephenate dehydrogenase
MFNRIAIIGTGLMGGSLALALRGSGAVSEVVACDSSPEAREEALRMGVADSIEPDPSKAARGSDIVFFATPMGPMARAAADAAPGMAPGTIVSDLASAKMGIMEELQSVLPEGARYVGGHPMAGSEQSGVAFARADLFRDRYYILTPTESTDPDAFRAVHSLLKETGARVISMDPESHDRAMATISHVPHLLSLLLMEMAADENERMQNIFTIAAGGFRDMTRIAASNPGMWLDIVSENRAFIVERLKDYSARVDSLVSLLEKGQGEELRELFEDARDARLALSAKSGAEVSDVFAISLPVPDEPGVISRITTAVGALGTNIEDIEIAHPMEGETGIMTLKVLGGDRAAEAAAHLESLGYAVSLGKA